MKTLDKRGCGEWRRKSRGDVAPVFLMLLSCCYSWSGEGGGGENKGEMKGKSGQTMDGTTDSGGSPPQQQKHDDHHQPSATASAPAKPQCCSHFPYPLLLGTTLTQPYTQMWLHMLKHRKATERFLTAEPSGINTNKDFNSAEFTGQWKQQHFGFATVYIRLYLTHIMTLRKGKFTHFNQHQMENISDWCV